MVKEIVLIGCMYEIGKIGLVEVVSLLISGCGLLVIQNILNGVKKRRSVVVGLKATNQ
jgi:hypothetical protein